MPRNFRTNLSFETHAALEELAAEKGWRIELDRRKNKLLQEKSAAIKLKAEIARAKELVDRYKYFLKKSYRKTLNRSISEVLRYLPPEVILKLGKCLECPNASTATLVQVLKDRVVFIPEKEYYRLVLDFFGKYERMPPAFAFNGHVFLELRKKSKERAFWDTSHEVVHMVRMLAGLSFSGLQDEALAVSLGLFTKTHKSARMRINAVNLGKEVYFGLKDSEVYVKAVNLGREAFRYAYQLEQESGPYAATAFFHKLFRMKALNSKVLSLAAQSAKQEALMK